MNKSCCNEVLNNEQEKTSWLDNYREYFPAVFSFILLITGLILNQVNPELFKQELQILVYGIAYFIVGKYAEGVAVMLFYAVGELFQEAALNKAKRSIESLLSLQAEEVAVFERAKTHIKHPKEVEVGRVIHVKPREKVPLDGTLMLEMATMWEAVFADVGVALLAILNAMRIQKMKF